MLLTQHAELPALSSFRGLAHIDANTRISGGNEFYTVKVEQLKAPLLAGMAIGVSADVVRRRKGANSPQQAGSFLPDPRR